MNEAEVEWPPSPWRIMRALVAVWYRKLDRSRYSRESVRSLLEAIAEADPPVYALPRAVLAHTRHFMPLRDGRKDKNSLVFDAFAHVALGEKIVAAWPKLQLSEEQHRLLDILLEHLGYLGRVESWVRAERLNGWDVGKADCFPAEEADGGAEMEAVPLYVPRKPSEYAAFVNGWSSTQVQDNGQKSRGRGRRKRAEAGLCCPVDWWDALSMETSVMQSAGWNHPPGARQVLYLRPRDCLRSRGSSVQSRGDMRYTTASFLLTGRPLPRIEETIRVGEAARSAFIGRAKSLLGTVPWCLVGRKDGVPRTDHRHAFYLPEDRDGDGRLDHLVVHVPEGFTEETAAALASLRRLYDGRHLDVGIVFENVGGMEILFSESPLFSSSTSWFSCTPYLQPWFAKKGFGLEEQIRRECTLRGFPNVKSIGCQGSLSVWGRTIRPIHFHRFRKKRGLAQPDRLGTFVRVEFCEPVKGPVSLGFGCHFGLGLFRAEG